VSVLVLVGVGVGVGSQKENKELHEVPKKVNDVLFMKLTVIAEVPYISVQTKSCGFPSDNIPIISEALLLGN